MANRTHPQTKDELRRMDDVNRLTALFKGRIGTGPAAELIAEYGSVQGAASFLLRGDLEEVKKRLEQNPEYVESSRTDSENVLGVLEDTHVDRQFACADCNKAWWKRVPARKMVSKCYSCRRKFDPVPREHEWGIGDFHCDCGRVFKGFGIMGRTKSQCHSCGGEAEIVRVNPPKKREDRPRRRNTHNCNGVNCHRRYRANDGDEKPPVCIHPRSPGTTLVTRVHWPSKLHVSTGSTLDTFLNQGSLDTHISSPAQSLVTILEHDNI